MVKEVEKEEKVKTKKKISIRRTLFGKKKSRVPFEPKKVKAGRRAVARRATGTGRFLGVLGVVSGKDARGPGRPKGTYKYGMPIHKYKKLRSRKRAQYQEYQRQQALELGRRGLRPEQINQLQLVRAAREREIPVDIVETPESVIAPVDDDLKFRKFRAEKTISPNTQKILRRLRHTQLKSERDDVDMQRRLKEKKMVAETGNIMETPFVFNKYQLDITGVKEDNILLAPSVFKENPEDNVLRTKKLNIMQTGEAGNNLKFF